MNATAIQSLRPRPLFFGNWERVVFVHYRVKSSALQEQVPFELDLWGGSAYVSIVAFSMRRLRLGTGGRWTEHLLAPIANHEFLNVRTYVRHRGRPGIYFMREWVNNPINRMLGPAMYGLPYRYARLKYEHHHERGKVQGVAPGVFDYHGTISTARGFHPCEAGSREEFLMERYSAFTMRGKTARMFDIWHKPWAVCDVELQVRDQGLWQTGRWFDEAERAGANYSPGVFDVWMGAPRRIN